jgi:hypothetical protein
MPGSSRLVAEEALSYHLYGQPMKYFLLNTMGEADDTILCFLGNNIEGLGMNDWRLLEGEPMGSLFPVDAKVFMDKAHPGMRLRSVVGNRHVYFIGSLALKNIIEQHCKSGIEFLPLSVYDHRKRLASRDYFVIHPLGTYDCLDEKASKLKVDSDGEVVSKGELILDRGKVTDAPELFRIAKCPAEIVLGERLINAITAADLTNVTVTPMRFSDGRS